MADEAPAPRPIPGSLRDRIAALEKPNASADNNPAPLPPCPKVGAISRELKPKPPSPKTPPAGSSRLPSPLVQLLAKTSYDVVRTASGSSASNAKEAIKAIGWGSGLKSRMAALQGRGGSGVLPAPVPLTPAVGTGKKWVPSPEPALEEEVVVPS
ncbi:hypothetical protein HMN09_01233900 [Mycena chlorophos]|uniref:Uncharacterized protein n=1 Tax=Mycena chlorophos TaxID=658473 RepID=A0A8H6S3N7_MYCCL|nr:hypothetical protein HMN09_01233900 [Mycena chlorophos]